MHEVSNAIDLNIKKLIKVQSKGPQSIIILKPHHATCKIVNSVKEKEGKEIGQIKKISNQLQS